MLWMLRDHYLNRNSYMFLIIMVPDPPFGIKRQTWKTLLSRENTLHLHSVI